MITNKPGKQRKFWKVLVLTIITFGMYFLYWLYRNLTEMENAFEFESEENQVVVAKRFYGAGFFLVLIYGISLVNIILENPQNAKVIFIYSNYYNLLFTATGLFLFFYFIRSVFLCQSKLSLTPFNKKAIYSVYIVRFAIDVIVAVLFFSFNMDEFIKSLINGEGEFTAEFLLGNPNIRLLTLLSLLSYVSNVVLVIFIYRLQIELNAIWQFYRNAKS